MRKPGFRFWVAAEVAAALLLGGVFLFWDSARVAHFFRDEVAFADAPETCMLNDGPCTALFPSGGEATLSAAPAPLRAMTPLRFTLRLAGIETEKATLEIYGINMDMGRYPVTLKPAGDRLFEGTGILPTCTGPMTWQAEAILEGTALGGRFRFTTE